MDLIWQDNMKAYFTLYPVKTVQQNNHPNFNAKQLAV